MIADANAVLQATVTKTATFNGAGIDTINGGPARGFRAEVAVSAATVATTGTAAEVVTFTIDVSSDNTTYRTLATAPALTLTATAQTADFAMAFHVPKNEHWYRLTATFAGSGTTPSISYLARVGDARSPGSVY